MEINYKSKLRYVIIDFINAKSWFAMAVSITLSAIACLWAVGLITIVASS